MRQKYLRASVDSWTRARGADQAQFIFCLEPPGSFPVADFTTYVEGKFPGGARVITCDQYLGCLQNTRRAMERALSVGGDGFAVLAEEDIEVSDDILEYFTWASERYRDDPGVLAVCAHTRSSKMADHTAVVRASWFAPLAWGTWKDRWDSVLAPAWGPQEGSNNSESWDNKLKQVIVSGGYQAVFPIRSRSLHIGEMSTLMGTLLGEYVYKASVSDCYSAKYPERRRTDDIAKPLSSDFYEHSFWPHGFHEVPYPEGGQLWV
jgi:hypothetical protein